MDDDELLREYVRSRSQDAFRQLVDRHLAMVFSAAQRMVRDAHLAEEIAQSVFTTLARKADSICPPQVIGGWLYHTTRNLALHTVRTEQRRREREQTAVAMQSLETIPDDRQILEQLEPAMAELETDDRDALVLRYLESRSLREVGEELGITEDAARMRVNRALERLRIVFGRQGTAVSAVALGAAIAAGTAAAVPAGLATAITTTALAGTAVTATALTHTTITAMNWINLKSAAVIIAAAALAGTGTYFAQQRQINRLRGTNRDLIAQRDKSRTEQQTAATAALAGELELARLRKDVADLPRLRNEVTQLRQQRDPDLQRTTRRTAQSSNAPVAIGAYFTKDQLAFAGYATPEATMQSEMWAMLTGDYDKAFAGLSPETQWNVLKFPKDRESFENNWKQTAGPVKGVEITAKRNLADDRVELKLKIDADSPIRFFPSTNMIIPLIKVGNEWRIVSEAKPYTPDWDRDGKIATNGQ